MPPGDEGAWPFSIPAINGWGRRTFDPGVTYLVGENGSGKSTLIEALAVAMGLNITAMSYDGHIDIGVIADRDQMPDVWCFIEWLEEALVELEKYAPAG